MKKFFWIGLIAFLITPMGLMAAEDATTQQIDKIWNDAYNQVYAKGLDKDFMCKMKENLDLCIKAVEKEPKNYEYLWRYARAASEYAEAAQSLRDEVPDWKDVCRKWGLDGFNKANTACEVEPSRPEAYFWRSYCMGKYVLIGGIEPIINAIKEGFLPKSQENVVKGYDADKTYLEYIPVFARFQFLSHVPSVPFLVKGSKKDRFKEAMEYYKEHDAATKANFKECFEWDVRAPYTAEFLLLAVDALGMKGCEKEKYLAEAKAWCELGLTGPRKYYVDWSKSMLDDENNWK